MHSQTRECGSVNPNERTSSDLALRVRERSESHQYAAPIRSRATSEAPVIAARPGTSHPRSPGRVAINCHHQLMPNDSSTDLDPQLLAFVPDTGHGVLTTIKRDGRPQMSIIGFAFER